MASGTEFRPISELTFGSSFAYVTLVTRPSYVPGALILAHSLHRARSRYPLVVLITKSLTPECVDVLRQEATANPLICVYEIDHLVPLECNTGSVADRFEDTYTKLRAFETYKLGYRKCVFLDADMAVFQSPDELFDVVLPDDDCIAASHACLCNLDNDPWAGSSWNKFNCAHSPLSSKDSCPIQPFSGVRPTYQILNSGMFVFKPQDKLWLRMLNVFSSSDKTKDYQFPDQDFLNDFFRTRWVAVPWKYNALKTLRYFHPSLWSDEDLVILHYIVDKPWDKRIASDGVAGHRGRDGETHRRWWRMYEDWLSCRIVMGEPSTLAMLRIVEGLIACPLTPESDKTQKHGNRCFPDAQGDLVSSKPMLGNPAIPQNIAMTKAERLSRRKGPQFNKVANIHAFSDRRKLLPSLEKLSRAEKIFDVEGFELVPPYQQQNPDLNTSTIIYSMRSPLDPVSNLNDRTGDNERETNQPVPTNNQNAQSSNDANQPTSTSDESAQSSGDPNQPSSASNEG